MAFSSNKLFVTLLCIEAILLPSISAVEFIVGDEKGWTINVDYQAWAQGKEFHVGDKLVFNYPAGVHNVLKVNGTGFAQCAAPAGTAALTSGNDVILLATEGRKWYICGFGEHCKSGNQKLVITVLPQQWSPSPSPGAYSPSLASFSSQSRFGLVVVVIGIIGTFFA